MVDVLGKPFTRRSLRMILGRHLGFLLKEPMIYEEDDPPAKDPNWWATSPGMAITAPTGMLA